LNRFSVVSDEVVEAASPVATTAAGISRVEAQ
jgi:hypothetical protein